MQGWVIIAVVAIIVWGVVQMNRRRAHDDNSEHLAERQAERQALIDAERERDELRERVQVLERIVTDNNTPDAQKTRRLAEEIENLRQADITGDANKTKEDLSE